ncbi:MAG: hypothetical protein ACRCZF_18875 [Gemmataceae bacterium]
MRTLLVFLRNTTEAAVRVYFDAAYPQQREPWVLYDRGVACLYIHFYTNGPIEHEPENWNDIVQRFGGPPAVGVSADVTGRCTTDEPVVGFVAALLSRFDGAAMDEATTHLWSLDDFQAGHQVEGYPFFHDRDRPI